MAATTGNPFRLQLKNPALNSTFERLLGLNRLALLYDQRPSGVDTEEFLTYTLDCFGIQLQVADSNDQLARVPRSGPLLIVANHPLGGLEGVAITKLMMAVRPDIKVLTNQLLTRIPELQSIFVGVDVLSENASQENLRSVRNVMRHLCGGGALLMFPAGKVATINTRNRRVEDHTWNRLAGKLQQRSGAACLPIHVGGYNSWLFYALALIHPRLRTALLPRQLTNKQNSKLRLTVGKLIAPEELRYLDKEQAITHYLRLSTEFINLKNEDSTTRSALSFEKIASPGGKVQQHLDNMSKYRLISSSPFDVYCATHNTLGPVMHEIGIAREFTFRAVGEGTGKAVDSDRFDPHYLHLFVWDHDKGCIAGGYRLGETHTIVEQYGMEALYASTLFSFNRDYLNKVGASLEMGRSFVHPDYQRHSMVLDLLWRGIGAYVANNPQYHTLFGAVSISHEYSRFSRALIADSMVALFPAEKHLMEGVNPIAPLKVSGKPWSKEMLASIGNISAINKLIERCDPGKTLPTLLRHYLSLNAKFICFSIDKMFNNPLSGLILVDLRKVPKRYLKRYFGREGSKRFKEKWQLD